MRAVTSPREYFDQRAEAFDGLYDGRGIRLLRGGPQRGRQLAVSVVRRYTTPAVLDVGCGPGRIAEAVIGAGARTYVGIDLSATMLALARRRLAGHAGVQLVEGDFLALDVPGSYEVVLALGLFEYLEEPARAADWIGCRCSGSLVASFTRWDWIKGPLRRLHYEVVHRYPIRDYDEARVTGLLNDAGFSQVEFPSCGRRGFLAVATR